jgi:hypothetical protein
MTHEEFRRVSDPGLSRPLVKKPAVSTQDIESLYQKTGEKLSGPVEVRWAWKYNDLKPRVYYAIGASCYHAAKYVRPIFNELCDLLRSTNRRTRYSSHRLESLRNNATFFIYDYTSFTSELTELKFFVEKLSDFLRDVQVTIIDSFAGPTSVSLGDLLSEYNTVCNFEGIFDLGPIMGLAEDVICQAKTGMLGVYGNIVGCTTIHGWCLTTLCRSEDRCNAVGDDAEGEHYDPEDTIPLFPALQVLGAIAEDKTKRWTGDIETTFDEDPQDAQWQFLKRPITRWGNRILTGHLLQIPNMAYVVDVTNEYRTVPFPSIDERRHSYCSQTGKLLDQIYSLGDALAEDDIEIFKEHLYFGYRELGLAVWGAPSGHYEDKTLAIPIIDNSNVWKSVRWTDALLDRYGDGLWMLPELATAPGGIPFRVTIGDCFESASCRALQWALQMGLLVRESKNELVYIMDDRSRVEDFLFGRAIPLYQWCVVESLPEWWFNLSCNLVYT